MAKLQCGLLVLLNLVSGVGFCQNHQFARLEFYQADDWSAVLAQFPKLGDSQKTRVLQTMKKFIELGQKEHLPDGVYMDFLPQLAVQRKAIGLTAMESARGFGYIQQAQALGELAANALEFALSQSSSQVRSVALETAEELMPGFYAPLVSGGHCGTGYDYLVGRFSDGFSDSLRNFASKNLAWTERVDPRALVEETKQLLRANLRLPTAKRTIARGLESDDEMAVERALIGVMQWPDHDFIPKLQALIIAEDSRVRPFSWLKEAVVAYREGTAAVLDPVLGEIEDRNHWMSELADYSCQESWEYCLRLANSSEAWKKELGVTHVKAMAQGNWMPVNGPNSLVPKDAMITADRIVQSGLSDLDDGVRAAAVSVHDWTGKTNRLLKFASDPSAKVRAEVAHYLSGLPDNIRAEYIWKLAGDSSLTVQGTVAWEISKEDDRGLEEIARKAARSSSARDRAACAVVLSKFGFAEEVLPLLKDGNAHVRASVLLSLRLNSSVGVEFILPLCGDEDSIVVSLAVEALLNRIEDDKGVVEILANALSLAKPHNTSLILRQIELVKKRIDDDGKGSISS